jgi:large subunit ribosomal protein L22
MGSRKHNVAEARKEAQKTTYVAKLNDNPTSPRKTRLTADMIRGLDVEKALNILQFSTREAAPKMRKLILSAMSNWQNKNEGARMEEAGLYIKELFIDGGRMLKRLRPAPQGRGHRIRKRSNHITLVLGSRAEAAASSVASVASSEEEIEEPTTETK